MERTKRVFTTLIIALGLLLGLMLLLTFGSAYAAGVTVDSTTDVSDGDTSSISNLISDPGSDGDISLREAIEAANNTSGADTIDFDTSVFSPSAVITITQGTLTIDDSNGGTTIDGDLDDDGVPDVEVRYGSGSVPNNGGLIQIRSSNNTIQGLAVTSSPQNGILVIGSGTYADNNQILDCWLGLDLTGADRGNSEHGVRIVDGADEFSSADNSTIQNCIASGNDGRGISLHDAGETQVLSNTVGLDPTGTSAQPNEESGIVFFRVSTTTVQGNVSSGNKINGIYIQDSQYLTLTDNVFGLNAAGDADVYNWKHGMYMTGTVSATLCGNTVSANYRNGIYLGGGSNHVTIVGNRIGTDITGTAGFGNGRYSNSDGIQIDEAYSNTIGGPDVADRNIIAHNGRAGIFIIGAQADHNWIQNNYIGTDVDGSADLGNGDYGLTTDSGAGGVYIHDGADYNTVQDNLIRFNYIGLRFSGGTPPTTLPPQHNQVLSNTLTSNDEYGVACKTTHWNITYTTPISGDNLIQNNVITGTGEGCVGCNGTGIFIVGGSPHIIGNTIQENENFGIVNTVYFGVDGPDDADDDLLSIPYIATNTIDSNANEGIRSTDTAPLNEATLLQENVLGNNQGEARISQRWFVAVEVVSNTETITSGLNVTITTQSGGQACASGPCVGSTFASNGGSGGIWGPAGLSYTNVVSEQTGTTTWFEVIEYEVDYAGDWVTYTSHLVEAGGDQQGSRYFDFDGVTTTDEISGDVNLPFCRTTGITGTDHSLCRYQIAQVDVFGSYGDGDYDDDLIPDEEEGTGDSDGDGLPDYRDPDSDNDGIPDETEGNRHSDGDGIPDFRDTDSDNDNIPDEVEGTGDSDGDGLPDYRDPDSDNDGIPDETEGIVDSDGDGISDYLDPDSDGDGIPDSVEGDDDDDGDTTPNYLDDDSDDNGIPDTYDNPLDTNQDGVIDENDDCPYEPSSGLCGDLDDDDLVDWLDPDYNDSDGDGIPDIFDTDLNNDGTPDNNDSDGDGIPDALDVDTDCDGLLDFRDPDDDGDGIIDEDEWYGGAGDDEFCTNPDGMDTDEDGTHNCRDNDVDGDGLLNHQDDDSDGDGTPDGQESYPDPNSSPFEHGDLPAWIDPVYRIHLPLVLRSF